MRKLSERIKRRIVEHLACYHSPAEVSDLIQEEFGIALAARHIRAYDPTSYQFAASPRWQEYHEAVRDRFRNEVGVVPITHRAYRLHRLQLVFEEAVERRNTALATSVLEQAAKEMGNWFVRRHN